MPFNHRLTSPKYHALKKSYFTYYSICLILGGDEITEEEEEEVEVDILVVVDIFVLFSKKIPTFDSPKSSRK